jgi:hypothetical protein
MDENSVPQPATKDRPRRPQDDVPSAHSSLGVIVPSEDGEPAASEKIGTRSAPADGAFRDAQENQGRAQDIEEDGLPTVAPSDAYRTAPGDNLER